MSGFRRIRNHSLEFRKTLTSQIQNDLTADGPTDLVSSDLVASTMVGFRHDITGIGEHPLPALLGFKRTILAWEENCLDGIGNNIERFLDQCPDNPLVDDLARELEVDSNEPLSDRIRLVFGVSGVGKTKHLESLLSRNWGFHFVAGSLDTSSTRTDINSRDLYGAHRNGHSLDLHWLWTLVTKYPDMAYGGYLHSENFLHWTLLLLYSRFLVLWVFKDKARLKSKDHPANWLLFQKSGDQFSSLFWLLLVRSVEEKEATNFIKKTVEKYGFGYDFDERNRNGLYVCLDEAQCDLEAAIHIKSLVDIRPTQSNFLIGVLSSFKYWSNDLCYDRGTILSGTSLRLADVRSAINSIDIKTFTGYHFIRSPITRFNRGPKSIIYCEFPLLISDDQLRVLLNQDKFFERFEMGDETRRILLNLGRPLWGRYLWSKLYIQQLNEQCSGIGATSLSEAIHRAADNARKIAKSHLTARLRLLYESGKHQLLEKICQMALDSHVFDRPTVFDDDFDHGVVTQGFAQVVISDQLKGCFAELLAVEAAMEWLVQYQSTLKSFLSQLLSNSSIHHSTFGFMAEWYLAFVS